MATKAITASSVAALARKVGWYVVMSAISLVVLFPIWMLLIRSVSNPSLLFTSTEPSLTPVDPDWGSFATAWSSVNLGRHLLMSLSATVLIVILQTATSILSAYAFVFLDFRFKRTLFAVFMATMLLPIEVTLIANISTLQKVGWIGVDQSFFGALGALTLPFAATALGTFLIRQGFAGIPRDLNDAATLDGWSHLGFIRHVAVPVTRPVIASFVVISFLTAYNQYLWPQSVGTREAYQTVQVALTAVARQRIDQVNLAFAAAAVASLPVVILLIAFQRHLIRGLTAGAVKG